VRLKEIVRRARGRAENAPATVSGEGVCIGRFRVIPTTHNGFVSRVIDPVAGIYTYSVHPACQLTEAHLEELAAAPRRWRK